MCLFQFSTCFEQLRAHHQENQLYQYNIWYMSLCVGDHFVCRSPIYQMLYWYNWFSWWWAWGCLKHVENWNKDIKKNCASSWSFTKNYWWEVGKNEKHAQTSVFWTEFEPVTPTFVWPVTMLFETGRGWIINGTILSI